MIRVIRVHSAAASGENFGKKARVYSGAKISASTIAAVSTTTMAFSTIDSARSAPSSSPASRYRFRIGISVIDATPPIMK